MQTNKFGDNDEIGETDADVQLVWITTGLTQVHDQVILSLSKLYFIQDSNVI